MSRWTAVRVAAFVLGLLAFPALAQDPQSDGPSLPPRDPELREQLFRYFESRLRTDLGLSDEQVAEILPVVRRMERERSALVREKREAMMDLRIAYREGADDERLQQRLDRVEEIDGRMATRMRSLMDEMDRSLNVRQRVEFRAFLERFRRELRDRVEQFRGNRRAPPRGRRPPGGPQSGPPSSPRP